jgi:predicted cobalt transporter CbtA
VHVPLSSALKRAILAGLAAALAWSVFNLVLTEPVIDRAIGVEEEMSQGHEDAPPVVSRDIQKGVGLVLGLLLYGATWALLYGVLYHLTQGWLPASTPWARGVLLAVMGYLSVALLPFLKYPANPPAVGDPATISYRQELYVALLVLSVAAVWLAAALARYVQRRGAREPLSWLAGVGFIVAFAAVVYALLPANPDPVHMPDDILGPFRWLSLAGLTLFWLVLGGTFAGLSRRGSSNPRRPTPAA